VLKIKRVRITEGQGHCGDKVCPFVSEVLKRRYGNSVTFCFDWELENIISQFKNAGLTAYNDNYDISISEPIDFEIGKTVLIDGILGNIPMLVKEITDDNLHGRIAKVKYINYPRKHAIWILVKTQKILEDEISKYGQGMIEAYKNHVILTNTKI
jgi:hypothetical protein